jgi:hypothetical protein
MNTLPIECFGLDTRSTPLSTPIGRGHHVVGHRGHKWLYLNEAYLAKRSNSIRTAQPNSLFESPIEHVLLIAGSLDGNGAVGNRMRRLAEEWNQECGTACLLSGDSRRRTLAND